MPLARIITTFTEESLPLQEQLRARGFEVETASPGQPFGVSADLEITVEEMTPAQALACADEIADEDDLPVFITPGSLTETSRPIVVVPIVPQPAPEFVAASSELVAQEEPEFDPTAFAETSFANNEQVGIETSVPVRYAEVEAATDALVAIPLTQAEPVVETAQIEQIAEPVAEVQPEVAPVEEPVVLAPEVQQILPELEAAMPDMEAWAREEGPASDWPIWQAGAIDPIELVTVAPAPKLEPVLVEPRQEVRTLRRKPFASDRVFWKTAAWAAMVALSALVLGATVHRFSPIPARFANSTQAVEAKPAQTNAPVSAPVTVKPAAALKRTAAHESRVTRPETPSRQIPSPKPAVKQQHKNSGDSIIAEDTVVRHRAKPPAPKVQAQMKSDGIKRYTDLK